MAWESLASTTLKDLRARLGLSQRELARVAGVPQSTISEIESMRRQPALPFLGRIIERSGGLVELQAVPIVPPASAAAQAREIADRLARGGPAGDDSALRSVIDLRDSLRRTTRGDRLRLVRERPDLTGDVRWDAFIAAVVEDECESAHLEPPRWVTEAQRTVAPAWYLSENPALHEWERETARPAFVRHGVLVAADELASV